MMLSKKQTKLNSASLESAYHDYNKGLNSYVAFKLHDDVFGEDLVQDTFIKTWNYLAKGGKIIIMKAFLYHILNNLIIDEYRKRKHKSESLDALVEKGFEPRDDNSERLTNVLDAKGAVRLMAELPDIYRKVMYMRFTQNLSLKEISLITGRTKNAIAVQIHRGLEKLKILYKRTPLFIY